MRFEVEKRNTHTHARTVQRCQEVEFLNDPFIEQPSSCDGMWPTWEGGGGRGLSGLVPRDTSLYPHPVTRSLRHWLSHVTQGNGYFQGISSKMIFSPVSRGKSRVSEGA